MARPIVAAAKNRQHERENRQAEDHQNTNRPREREDRRQRGRRTIRIELGFDRSASQRIDILEGKAHFAGGSSRCPLNIRRLDWRTIGHLKLPTAMRARDDLAGDSRCEADWFAAMWTAQEWIAHGGIMNNC